MISAQLKRSANLGRKIIHQFYTAFKNLDAETMVSLYQDDIMFEDPAFGVLKG